MSWTDWTSGEWLGKLMPQWPPTPARLPEAMTETMSRLADVFGFSPAAFLHRIVAAASAGLVGRQLETTIGGQSVHLVLDSLDVKAPELGPLVGQYGTIDLQVHNVHWGERRVEDVRVRAENVHLQPGAPSIMVAAPVALTATIDEKELAALLAETRPDVVVGLTNGVATAAFKGRERWGHVEIAPVLRGDVVRLKPVSAVVRGRRLDAVGRIIPAVELRLPALPRDARFTDVAIDGDRLRLDVVLDQWREPLQPSQLQDFERRLRHLDAGVFRLPRARAQPNSTQ